VVVVVTEAIMEQVLLVQPILVAVAVAVAVVLQLVVQVVQA
jgi:hypothetical protein